MLQRHGNRGLLTDRSVSNFLPLMRTIKRRIKPRWQRRKDARPDEIIQAALDLEGGNRTRAALRLGVSVRTVQRHVVAGGS